MGAFTPIDEIWYPDEDDTAEQNVNLAAMASSIEEGLGFRLRQQEKLVSAVLNVANNSVFPALPANTLTVVPFVVTGFGYNIGGMTLNAGTLTIQEPGIYFISSTVTFQDNGMWYHHNIEVSGVERVRGFSYKPTNNPTFQYSAQTSVVKLSAGDTVRTRVTSENGVVGAVRDVSIAGNVMSCTLLKPL